MEDKDLSDVDKAITDMDKDGGNNDQKKNPAVDKSVPPIHRTVPIDQSMEKIKKNRKSKTIKKDIKNDQSKRKPDRGCGGQSSGDAGFKSGRVAGNGEWVKLPLDWWRD
jgi:hypothetical protein